MPGTTSASACKRNRSIKLAIVTSLASKVGSAVLQLVSLPIAARVLGKQEFGLYATISMTITLILLLELGVGPALAQNISKAASREDKRSEQKYYAVALLLITGLALLGSVILGLVLIFVPIPTLFGENYRGLESVMIPGLVVGMILFFFELVLSHTDQTREGYMEANHSNAWGAVGNSIAAICVAVGVTYIPSVSFLLFAVFGPHVICRILNTVFLLKKRPHLLPRFRNLDRQAFHVIFKDGIGFTASYALTAIVEFNLCALIVGRVAGPESVAMFQVLVTLTIVLNGLILMFTNPLRPALIDAWAKNDTEWILAAAKKIYLYVLLFSVVACVGMIILGPWILPKWYGSDFVAPRVLFVTYAFYFLANAWRRGNYPLVIGVGKILQSAKFTLFEIGLTIIAATTGMQFFGLVGIVVWNRGFHFACQRLGLSPSLLANFSRELQPGF